MTRARLARSAAGCALSAAAFFALGALLERGTAPAGLALVVTTPAGDTVLQRTWPGPDLRLLEPVLPRARPLRVRLTGLWKAERGGRVRLQLRSEGEASLRLGGTMAVARREGARSASTEGEVELSAGAHALELEAAITGPATLLRLRAAEGGGELRDLDPAVLFARAEDVAAAGRRAAARGLRTAALLCALLSAALVAGAAWAGRREQGAWPAWWATVALPLAVTLLAGVLRLQAMVGRNWQPDAPPWARELAAVVGAVAPEGLRWEPNRFPWIGDPYTYLQAAREKERGFYSGHAREPVFILAVRALLTASGGQDAAVQLTSLLFSALLAGALCRLGGFAFSPAVGLLAGLLFAVEREAIAWSVEGWRDDAFVLFVVLTAEAVLRAHRDPRPRPGLLAGLVGGLGTLTRITSLSFLGPALGWLAADHRPAACRAALLAATVAAAVVAPYLVACAVELGDPLASINVHTAYYRGQALPPGPMSVPQYLRAARPPFEALDVLLRGLTVYPFANKWRGFDYLGAAVGPLLALCSLTGLASFALRPEGRLLLVVAVGAVAPFALTWDLPGGSEWRFTLAAYPFLLLAAAHALERGAAALGRGRSWRPPVRVLAVAAAAGLLLWAALTATQALRVREAVRLARTVTVAAGATDAPFLALGGWGLPHPRGNLVVRTCPARCTLRLPTPAGGRWTLRLRLAAEGEVLPMQLAVGEAAPVAVELRGTATRAGMVETALPVGGGGWTRVTLAAEHPFAFWYFALAPLSP